MNNEKSSDNVSTMATATSSSWSQLDDDDDNHLLLVNDDVNLNTSSLRCDQKYVGFDNNVGDTWIYPSNFPERAYQYNIVQNALFHNTLVVLPTGLGKTFIAAVVMYNIYRWYPMGKVIFMAPTRPLVAQQIDACCKIVGIPKEDSVEITGKLNKASRAQLWQSKRVFFATPQSVQSDIMDTELNFPFHAVKLIVVDEAHRAKGRYAYTDVVSYIWSKNKYFRILALSATPGRRKDDVGEIIRNLFISTLEIRTEDSVDVVSYVHKRLMKTVVVELGPKLSEIRDELLTIADSHIRNLIENRLISGRPGSISRNWLVMEQKRFRETLPHNRTPMQKDLCSDFSICISMYHAIELLERHGLRVFLNNFDETQDGGAKFVVLRRPDLRRLIARIREEIGPNPFAFSDECMVNGEIAPIPTNIDFGHPKFEIARENVLAHFESNKEARVIIFCEYRESVVLMHRLLLQHRPLIRPRVFVGQGGTGSIRAVTQKQQIKAMNEFRSGESNALIATSVAEEGIDVGEVDLIVCFDINTTNPTRFIQRIGRTGRKKAGKVLLLATEGKEHTVLKEVLSERKKLNKSISRGGEFASVFYKQAPRMVPTEFNPKCRKTFIQPTLAEPKIKSKDKPTSKEQLPKLVQRRDLRHFFKQTVNLNDEEKSIFSDSENKASVSNPKATAILDENEPVGLSPPKFIDINDKKRRKIVKYLRSSLKGLPADAQKALTSNRLCKQSLQFLLDFSPDLLVSVWARLQDLWKKGIDENRLPLRGISAEDRLAVRAYFQILKIYGSKENIALQVKSKRDISKVIRFSSLMEKYSFIFGAVRNIEVFNDNFDFLMKKYEQIANHFPSNECLTDIAQHSMVYDDEIDEMDHSTVGLEESMPDYSNDCVSDSKYMSQWVDDISHICERNSSVIPSHAADPGPNETKNENYDDDVIFVGVSLESTPLRKGIPEKSLLNFNETPIVKTVSKCAATTQRSQKNDETREAIKCIFPVKDSKKSCSEDKDHHMSFFDDQFDAIIAANSQFITQIENSSAANQKFCLESGRNVGSYSENPASDVTRLSADRKTTTRTAISVNDVTSLTPKFKTRLLSNYSTPDRMATTPVAKLPDSSNSEHETTNCPNSKYMKSDLRVMVHPELADIDFDNFSENFSDDIVDDLTQIFVPNTQASPDIFEELSVQNVEAKDKENSPKKQGIPTLPEVSPCLLTKKTLTWREVRLKYGKPSQSNSTNPTPGQPDDSIIHVASNIRSKRRIIKTDSDSSDNNQHQETQKFVRRSVKKSRISRKRSNNFVDDEAAVSGSATEDEFDDTIGCYMVDSVIVHDDDAENNLVNMTEVYLQSVRSPRGNSRGAFKIPARRQFNDASKIFSQRVPEDDGSYMNDSFVVSDEGGSDIDQSICPLERAEEILKVRSRAKRKAKMIAGQELKQSAKRKRILMIHHSSEDDEDFV